MYQEVVAGAPLPSALTNKFAHLWHLVGNTPMLALHYTYRGQPGRIFVKCEHYNLTGSLKDRMALYILQQAYEQGKIQPGDTIVEATSGNTGIAFAAIGKALGHPVRILMPDWLSRERIDIIRSLGAEVMLISKAQGGFLGSIKLSEEMAAADGRVFLTQQFENCYNAEAHARTTAPKLRPSWPAWAGAPMLLWRAWARAAPSWARATTSRRSFRACAFTRSSRPSRRLSPRATKWARTASRVFPTNLFRPS